MTVNLDRTPIAKSPISAVLPAFQAEKEITGNLESLIAELGKLDRDYEVIVIDDASSDGTAARVEELTKRFPKLRLVRSESALGYGPTLSKGLTTAQHPLIFTFAADGSVKAHALPKMLEAIDEVDIVCGVRKPHPGGPAQNVGWLAYFLFGLWLHDVSCPVRLYRRTVFDRLPIQSKGTFAEAEILAKANFLEALMVEVEVEWQATAASKWPSVSGDARRLFLYPKFISPAKTEPTPQPTA
jgi:glycosyltransferase involved in cell wall biosynthesis